MPKAKLKQAALEMAARRGLKVSLENVHESPAVNCSKDLSASLALSVTQHQKRILKLPSGAGHDAVVMAKITPVAMLFIRCKGGVSHNPAESVKVQDAGAVDVLNDFILRLAKVHEQI